MGRERKEMWRIDGTHHACMEIRWIAFSRSKRGAHNDPHVRYSRCGEKPTVHNQRGVGCGSRPSEVAWPRRGHVKKKGGHGKQMEHAKRLNASGSIASQIEVQVAFGKNGSQGKNRSFQHSSNASQCMPKKGDIGRNVCLDSFPSQPS